MYSYFSIFFTLIDQFLDSFRLSRKYGEFLFYLLPPSCSLPHYQHPPPEQYIRRHCETCIDTQSPKPPSRHPSEFTLGVAHSTGLENCMMAQMHHCSTVHSIFSTLKTLCALPTHFYHLPFTPANHGSSYRFHRFSRMSYIWNHTVCSLFQICFCHSEIYI